MSQYQRINEIHRRLREKRRFTAGYLARELEVSERTIRRDLEFMRDQQGLPLEFDKAKQSWFYRGSVADLTIAHVGPESHLVLLIARQAVEQFKSTPLYDNLLKTLNNIVEAFPPQLRREHLMLAEKMRFEGPPTPTINGDVWRQICYGLQLNQILKMVYRTAGDGAVRTRKVDPYGIVIRNREWYLVGWDHLRGDIRTFYFPRIISAEALEETFNVRDKFSLDEYLEESVDAHQSKARRFKVKLRFTAEGTSGGQDFFWTKKQTVRNDKQGRLIVEFTTSALYAVQRHVLSWGGQVEVLSPPELRASVLAAAAAVENLHGENP